MRRRLINSTLAVVLVVIAVFGVSLVIVETRTISSSAQESVDLEAVRLVSIVDSRLLGGERVTEAILREQINGERYAKVEIPGRQTVEIGAPPRAVSSGAAPRASRARPSRSRSPARPSPANSGALC